MTARARPSLSVLRREFAMWRVRRRVASEFALPLSNAYGSYGAGSIVLPPARVQLPEQIRIGAHVILHEHAWLCLRQRPGEPPPHLSIGDDTTIGRAVRIDCIGDVNIGREVLMADFVYISDVSCATGDTVELGMEWSEPVTIHDGVFLGIRAQVHPGVTIGERSYVAGGAVVVSDVPPMTVVAGNPAHPIRRYDSHAGEWKRVGLTDPDES